MQYNFSDRVKNLEANAIREIFKLISNPNIISFAGGLPASSALPVTQIKDIINQLLSQENSLSLLQYGATEGYLPLLKQAIEYVKRVGITNVNLENMLAISGGQQGIDLMCKAFLNKDDVVLVESPTYLAVLHIIKTYEATAIGVKSNYDGIDLHDLQAKIIKYKPKMIYLVPTFSNPTGITIDETKRKAIAKMINEHNIMLIEDNPYGELRFMGSPQKAIKSFDENQNIVYLTSFSKIISPGMRVGIAVGNKDVIRKLTIGKQATDVHTGLINQAAVAKFLEMGLLDPMLKSHIPLYRDKCTAMLDAMAKYFPKQVTYTKPEGGLFIWVTLPEYMDSNLLFKTAVNRGVAFVPGTPFFADGKGENTLRLNFSNASLEKINNGIKILGDILKENII